MKKGAEECGNFTSEFDGGFPDLYPTTGFFSFLLPHPFATLSFASGQVLSAVIFCSD
jgi:hypothetical protein